MKRSISILGCGWLGLPLGISLVKNNYIVSGSTTTKEKLTELEKAGLSPFLIDLNREEDLLNNLEFFKSPILIISIPPRRKAGMEELYLTQLRKVVATSSGFNPKVILISSTSVYPNSDKEVRETDPTIDDNVMVKAENLIKAEGRFESTIIRFAGLIGPDRHPGKFFAGKTNVIGPNQPVNLIHRDDCIALIEGIIENNSWGETFNACADHHPPKKEFYIAAARSIKQVPPEFSTEEGSFKIINSEKIKKALNYNFKYGDPFQMLAY